MLTSVDFRGCVYLLDLKFMRGVFRDVSVVLVILDNFESIVGFRGGDVLFECLFY